MCNMAQLYREAGENILSYVGLERLNQTKVGSKASLVNQGKTVKISLEILCNLSGKLNF